MRTLSRCLTFALLLIPAAAQAQVPFILRVQQGDNLVQVSNGSTLAISSSSPGTARTLQVLITYTGSTSVSFPNGAATLGSPAFSAQLTAGGTALTPDQTATVQVVFSPSGTDTALGELDIGYVEAPLPGGQFTRGLLSLALSGGVPVYSLSYSVGSSGNVTALPPGGQLVFPDTVTNNTTAAAISLGNQGSGPGRVTSVTISGSAFTLAALPALPTALNTGASIPFQVAYLPRQAGNDTGTLTVGFDGGTSQQYQLQGRSVLSQLSYETIQTSSGPTPILPNQTIQFPQTSVGAGSSIQVRLTNSSRTDFTLSAVTSTGTPFGFSGLPVLPTTLAPGAAAVLTVSFNPTQSGPFTGSLRIGADTFGMSGTATGLPEFTISGPTQVEPLQQPAVSLALSQAYPVAVNGTLNLGVASDYTPDPSVQFSSGGRTVNFTIPANSTNAVFPNGSSTIRLQTGSVASTFTLTPSFSTQQGVDLTPSSPATLVVTLPASAPNLLGIQVAAQGNTSLTLQIFGVTTLRSLTKLDIHFTAAAGFNVPDLSFTLDLASPSLLWFSSTASQAFGGQFALNLPFVLATSDTGTAATPPVQALQSVSATVSSSAGDSNTVSLNLQ